MAPTCAECGTTDGSLQVCTRCKIAKYCDRDCQKAHWKAHRRECGFLAMVVNPSETSPPQRSDSKPFTAIYHGNFLHDRSKEETYKILIDVVRMRQRDSLALEGTRMAGTVHAGEKTSEKALRECLRQAQQKPNFLPGWWNDESTDACVQYGLNGGPFSLAAKPDKAAIQVSMTRSPPEPAQGQRPSSCNADSEQNAWGDHLMPMKLRMSGEAIYGDYPASIPGQRDHVLRMQMSHESGDGSILSYLQINLGA